MKTLLTTLIACCAVVGSVNAGTVYTWTGSTSNQLGNGANWLGGVSPFNGNQARTPAIDDIVLFDSNIFSTTPQTIYVFRSNKWGNITVTDGTINAQGDNNSFENKSWSGTDQVVVGDGDNDPAVLNLRLRRLNSANGSGSTSSTKTYIVRSDGTLVNGQSAKNVTPVAWSSGAGTDTVMRLLGGASIIDVELNEAGLTDDADDYVSFEGLGSTFTFVKGDAAGQFDELSDIIAALGDSFRLGGALNSGNAQLDVTEVDGSWVITANPTVIPQPIAGAMALVGLGVMATRRRRK